MDLLKFFLLSVQSRLTRSKVPKYITVLSFEHENNFSKASGDRQSAKDSDSPVGSVTIMAYSLFTEGKLLSFQSWLAISLTCLNKTAQYTKSLEIARISKPFCRKWSITRNELREIRPIIR